MQKRAEELLVQTVNATSDNNSILFKNVQNEVTNTAKYTSAVFSNPGSFTTSWRFDQHVFRKPTGQWWNASTELPNILLGNFITPNAAIKKDIELLHNLDFLAPQVLSGNTDAAALYFIGANGESFYYPNIDLGNIIPPDLNPATLDFFTVATPENNPEKTVKWTPVYDDPAGNGLLITASHPVYTESGTFKGVMSMDVTLNNIASNIENYSPIESSYAFLIDNDGRAVALPAQGYKDILSRTAKKGEFGPDLRKVGGDFGAILAKMRAGKKGFITANANDTNLYIAYAPVKGTAFSLGIVAKEDVLLKVLGDIRAQVQDSTTSVLYLQILPFAAAILILVWYLGFVYIRYLTGPIIALTEKTNRIMQGSLTQEIDVKTSDNEVGKLAAAFNKMTRELAASYKALENKVVEVGDAKAKDDAILNSIGDGLVVTDTDGKVLLVNDIAAELLGLEQGKRAGQRIDDREFFTPAGKLIAAKERPMQAALETGKKINREVVLKGKGDSMISLNITASPVRERGETIGAIQIIRDVTEEKEVDRMKTEFISVASHQMRTPLSGIKWFAQMLLQGDAGKLKGDQIEFVKNISGSTDRMIELVNSLLNISSLEGGRIVGEPAPTDIKELLDNVAKDQKMQADDRKQKLSVSVEAGLPKMNIDPKLLAQVYVTLLTNSIKYTPKEGSITVSVSRKGNDLISQVTDTGYGIPAAEQKKIFSKFFRGSNVMKVETDGTGLGMFLAKTIVESADGKIWFESKEGKGTTVWFSLPIGTPIASVPKTQAAPSEQAPADQNQPKA